MTSDTGHVHVVLTGWQPPVQKIPLVKVLREHVSLSLAEATAAVDRCLRGETVSIATRSPSVAEALVRAVSALGLREEVQQPVTSAPTDSAAGARR